MLAFSSVALVLAVSQSADAQPFATRTNLGSAVGTNIYRENSGWNTGGYISSSYGVQYTNVLNGNNPWLVHYGYGNNRANSAFHAPANKLSLYLAGKTHTISTYSGGSLSGDISIGDFYQNGSYLEVLSGTLDNNNTSGNRLLNGYYSNKDALFKVGNGGNYYGYHGYNGYASGSDAAIELSNGGYLNFLGPFYNSYNSSTTGALEVRSGADAYFQNSFFNGNGSNSRGTVTVDGSGSTLQSGTFYNGRQSGSSTYTGYLDIDNNGRVDVNGNFYNGFYDGGRLEITTGGVLDVSSTAFLGHSPTSGPASVTELFSGGVFSVGGAAYLGASSRAHIFNNNGGTFEVGSTLNMPYNTNSLYFSNSPSAVLRVGAPADISGATGGSFRWNYGKVQFIDPVVTLAGAQLGSYTQYRGSYRLYPDMTLEANGILNNQAPISLLGGTVAAGSGLNLSNSITGFGIVDATVSGGSLANNTATMHVGGISGGGTHSTTATMNVGINNQSTTFSGNVSGSGSFNKTGTGTLTLAGSISSSAVALNGGTLALTTGSIQTNTFSLNTGTFSFTGGELNVGTFNGSLVQGGGLVTIGASPGNTDVNGDYTQSSGSLEIELGGTTAVTEFDTLTVTGTATLGGDLDVALIDLGSGTFEPQWGQSFEILSASAVSGTFANENLPTLADDLYLTVDYQSSAVSLAVGLTGDFNNNGFWDDADLDLLADAAINDPSNPFFDLDGNGTVEFAASLSGVSSDSDYFLRILMDTQYGDANLDGKVDVLDLDQLGQGFQGSGTGWLYGDFDGTGGMTDVVDLDILGQTFGFDNSPPPLQAVPEPAGLVLLAIASSLAGSFRFKKC